MDYKKELSVEFYRKLQKAGVIKQGHFKLTSGNHSNVYCNKDTINQHFILRNEIIDTLLSQIYRTIPRYITKGELYSKTVVTGPAIAGAIWASPIANFIGIPFVYPEKDQRIEMVKDVPSIVTNGMVFRRGYDQFLKGKFVIIVEDIISTGGSVRDTIKAVTACGGTVLFIVSIWNRTGVTFQYESNSIIIEPVPMWEPIDCPQCNEGIPLCDPKIMKIIQK